MLRKHVWIKKLRKKSIKIKNLVLCRLNLESEEQEHRACVEAVQREQARVKQLQEELHQERLSSKHAQEEHVHVQEVSVKCIFLTSAVIPSCLLIVLYS